MHGIERRVLAAIFVGGMAGALVRTALTRADPAAPGTWPWVTFAVNLAGAFVLGGVVAWGQAERRAPPWLRPLVGTGFCGALTTFSTMQVELVHMEPGLALAYAAASVAGGLVAVGLAVRLVRP
jgi:CrcB protein